MLNTYVVKLQVRTLFVTETFLGLLLLTKYPANKYLFKINNRNTRKRCEICSKLNKNTKRRYFSNVFIANFEHISHLFSSVSIATLNKKNVSWEFNSL